MNTKNSGETKVTWDDAVEQFENLVKFAAKQEAQRGNLDGMSSAEDLYQIGMIKLYDCWLKWCHDETQNKGMEEFGPIFRTSLFREVRKRRKQHQYTDLEEGLYNVPDTGDELYADLYQHEAINMIKANLTSDISEKLLDELLNPSWRTLCEVVSDIKRKQMLRSQGKRVNIPQDNTVRMKHIVRSLNITTKQYDIAIAEIREVSRVVLEVEL